MERSNSFAGEISIKNRFSAAKENPRMGFALLITVAPLFLILHL
jgi:hypothetical protein